MTNAFKKKKRFVIINSFPREVGVNSFLFSEHSGFCHASEVNADDQLTSLGKI